MEEKPNYYAILPAEVRYDKRLKANEKVLYSEITALTLKTGECWASNNYFAKLYEITPQAVSKWILNLQKCGYIKIDYERDKKEIKKRIIRVSTNIDRVSTNVDRGYQQMIKENNINSIKNNNICANELAQECKFEELWKLYPKKKGKTQSLKKYLNIIKKNPNKNMYEIIKQGIINYKKEIETKNIDTKYIKNGSTWFNQECWNDDYEIDNDTYTRKSYIDEDGAIRF